MTQLPHYGNVFQNPGNLELYSLYLLCDVHEKNSGGASGLTIGVIYRPPNCQDENDEHLRRLLEYVDKIKKSQSTSCNGRF